MKKVAMIGVGKLGQDCAEVMADAGYDVVGYDVEPRLPMFPMKDTIEEAVKDRDFIFIAAPTPHKLQQVISPTKILITLSLLIFLQRSIDTLLEVN
jgi:3-hydroxyisobutyrate dehydrogenase-like beta-hydroxyacid dehydrogenase